MKLKYYILFTILMFLILGCDSLVEKTTTTTISSTTTTIGTGTTTTTINSSLRIEDIRTKWLQLKPKFSGNYYEVNPSTYNQSTAKLVAPYSAGQLKAGFLEDALNMTNFVRFLAKLPYDVVLDSTLVTKAQHGAVLLCASSFSHTPTKPADMDDTFYQLGYSSTSSSNIGWGYSTLTSSIKDGYMSDGDSSNIDRVGHRRWILNPKLLKTGFGYAYSLMTMQVFDQSRTQTFDYDYISWPSSSEFPIDFFKNGDPWSVTLNPAKYTQPSKTLVTVILKSVTQQWTFNQNDTNKSGKYFNVETSGYGVNNCIIFRPDGITLYTGSYTVEIIGIKDKSGNDTTIKYTVTFFSL
ncbi:MAG: hypothetical protein A2086_04675 [Spirochaetes bacterium GWD1_27_9]|nr:MAG: hypothetical protein A2Z98_16185 [Spirochaetes bacterium GWB1_27_13]OHD25316.1 MAG: hypothetical protein A2Y34_03845 [Spirochaetes bacterium GWC1_27_15]OHD29560.1 MAG: hypothetical protein A2086_04675 [Spirochaetes bacterium GWD1_27_9]